MSISLLDNLSIKKKSPNVERDLFNTVTDMVAFSENYLPSVFECNVAEDGNRYRYNVANSVDATLGKWRLVSSDGASNLVDYYKRTETDALLENYVAKETGKVLSSNDYTTLEKEKLASLENYDDTAIREHITTYEKTVTDIQTVIGSETLNTTSQTLKGAINEVRSSCDSATSVVVERVAKNETDIATLNSDETVSGSVKEATATTLAEAKAYTDKQIREMDYDAALVVDEKPVFNEDDWTITYVKDGVTETTEGTQIWFYYMEDGKLMQTIWVGDTEMTVVSAGGVNFSDYVSKLTDVVSTYNGAEADTTKVPDLAAMKALQTMLQTNIDDKISGDAILDVLDSSSTSSALSANQGRVLNETLNTKLDKTFVGDEVANKPLVTDSMGNVVLGTFDEVVTDTSANAPRSKAVKAELDKKLSIEQGVDKVGFVPMVAEDGNLVLRESSVLGGTAELTAYTNDNYPELTDVDKALDKILAKIYYVAPKINSFTCSANSEYEIGTTLSENTIVFEWATNKEVTGQTLTDCIITATDRTTTFSSPLSSTKTFVLTISDSENTATASKKISFLPKVYFGSTSTEEINSAVALGLGGRLSSTVKGDYSFSCGSGEYAYIISPTSFSFNGNVWVNGFQAEMQKTSVISLTNESGYTQSYDVWRFTNSSLGAFTATIK